MAIEIHRAEDRETLERIYRFRYAVHVGELGKGGAGIDHARRMIIDDADATAVQFYAEDDGRIVGTTRGNWGVHDALPDAYRSLLETDPAEQALGRPRVSVCSRLMVDPSYRGRTLASLLVLGQYDYGLSLGTTVSFAMCEVPLLRLYYRLGYRTYRSPVHLDGLGMRVPLVLCARDRGWLNTVGSPFGARVSPSIDDRGAMAETLEEIYPGFQREALPVEGDARTLWARLADGISRTAARPSLFDGLPDDAAAGVFASSASLGFREGDVVRRHDDRSAGLGVILSGRLGVGLPTHDGWHWLELLDAGEVFGDPGTPSTARATDLVALEDTRVAFLHPKVFERVAREHPALAVQLTTNLARVLQQRVDDLHRRSAQWAVSTRDRLTRNQTIPPIQETHHVGS